MDRHQRRERKYIQFTPRDGLTLKAVFEARYLTNVQVRDLFYKPTTFGWCKQRLKYLFDKGFLAYRQASIIEPFVYYLALKGRRYIGREGSDWNKGQIDRIAGVKGGELASDLQLRHDLTLSQLYVYSVLQSRRYGWDLKWENARMLEIRNIGIQPDAWFRVQGEGVYRRALIEFTSAMPDYRQMQRKLERYTPALEHFKDSLVLWFTTSQDKRDKLYRWTEKYAYRQWILFGLIEDWSEFLTEPIWKVYDREGRVRLIDPQKGWEARAALTVPGEAKSSADTPKYRQDTEVPTDQGNP